MQHEFARSDIIRTTSGLLADALNDIATQIHIQSAFQIQHSRYQPLDLPEAAIDRYRQLPQALQRRYQCQKLRDYLYDIYFSHEQDLADNADHVASVNTSSHASLLQNDSVRGINRAFYEQIQAANQGKGYFDPGWLVIGAGQTHLAVQKQGLTVQIDPNRHLRNADRCAQIGSIVAIQLPKNRLESGFYVVVGNAGLGLEQSPSLEIYFHISATGAIALMQQLTQALNDRQIAFSFKVLYDPTEYGRYDAGTLCLKRNHYSEIAPLLKHIYHQTQSEFGSPVPLFTKPLAPGLGLAEEPEAEIRDFGLHRCQLIAQGLLNAWENGDETPEQRLSCIYEQFAQNNINLKFPYLNSNSIDIYLPLD